MVARFDVQKDHATLLKALSTLRHLSWELRLAGDGPLLPDVMAMARKYGLSSRIDFMNQCSDVPALLGTSDIFVLSSHWEAFPISILEAMRAGLPVIATDTGGVFEAVKDLENEFLVRPHDFSQMAAKLSALILSPELCHDMGIRSQSQFESMFDWRHMLDKTEMLYASALEDRLRHLRNDKAVRGTSGGTRPLRQAHGLFSGLQRTIINSFIDAKQREQVPVGQPPAASKRSSHLSALVLFAVDSVSLISALWLSLFMAGLLGRFPSENVVLQLCMIVVVAVLTLALGGLYPSLGTTGLVESKRIFRGVSFVQNGMFLCFWVIGAHKYELGLILLFWVLSIVFVISGRSVTRTFLSSQSWWGESVLLIGSPDQMAEIAELLHHDHRLGLHVGGLLNEDAEPRPAVGAPVFEDLESAVEFCLQAGIRTAIVMLKMAEGLTVSSATSRYSPHFPKLIIFPLIGPRRPSGSRARVLSKQLSIEASVVSLMRNRRHLKRFMDLVLALTAGVVLSPLLIAIAIAVKLTSRGPVFFGHRRVGRCGKTFFAWKFRTMVVGAGAHLGARLAESPELRSEWEQYHKLRKDPRIIKIGLFLRKYSLDELPQLWNIVCSEMSIVGPRPIIADEIAKYSDCFHCYSRVLPGITGLWQVSGRNETSYEERVELDTYYVNSWSLWLDLYILCRSVTAVFQGRGAY